MEVVAAKVAVGVVGTAGTVAVGAAVRAAAVVAVRVAPVPEACAQRAGCTAAHTMQREPLKAVPGACGRACGDHLGQLHLLTMEVAA